ncbi:DUF4190 domain-containing protein [Streptomyces kebangsaanensis]|uniref:DUF4190 domain-containing protein n=1 Tax=Streptomyces kebangsaanensis TaxID=864058 RepID=UPI00093A41DA|nr:DUF4190 domain-containing protein [Streptomyces kebangsaanensis]
MPACGCTNLGELMAHLAGLGLLAMAGLVLGVVCLIGLLLSAIVALGHLARRRRSGDHEDGNTGPDEERVTLASFRWETAQEADDTR